MESLRRIIGIFLLVLFVAYSGGIGFSVHHCEHCRQKEIYLFQHPDCCSTSEAEHRHGTDNQPNNCSHSDVFCTRQEVSTVESLTKAIIPHYQPCCFSEFQFYKIYGNYFASKYEKLIDDACIDLFVKALPFNLVQLVSEKINFSENNLSPPPLLPGGKLFVVFSHQLLFYV